MTKKKPTFEEAINIASILCTAWEKEELSEEVFADKIDDLLTNQNGARGFFVISLLMFLLSIFFSTVEIVLSSRSLNILLSDIELK